jgi:threonine synthase
MNLADPILVCRACGSRSRPDVVRWRCECGGMFDLDPGESPLPARRSSGSSATAASMWRYAAQLPFGADHVWPTRLTMGEGGTPLVTGSGGGAGPMFKLEYVSPTGSFKDRGAVVVVAVAAELGATEIVADSSGNAGTAISAYAARAGIRCSVFVPDGTSMKKLRQMRAHGAIVHEAGTREDAAAAAIDTVQRTGAFYASHVYSPFFVEGTKTFALEVIEELGRCPELFVLPVGNGTLVLGVTRVLDALAASGWADARPRLLLVQSSACAPIADAVRRGATTVAPARNEGTIAEGIAIAAPARGDQLLDVIRRYDATVVTVDDYAVEAAARWLAARGMYVEPTAAAPLAGLQDAVASGLVESTASTVVPLSGSGSKAA